MIRLKYSCPFLGHTLPIVFASFALPFGMITGAASGLGMFGMIAGGLACPAAVLFAFFLYYQRLSLTEKALCEECEQPLWYPLPERQIKRIRKEITENPIGILHASGAAAVAGVFTLVCLGGGGKRRRMMRHENAVPLGKILPAAFIVAALAFLAVILIAARRRAWTDIDESAVHIIVPVHHSYDLTRYGKHGHKWTENYIVCYLPDGRYVLHNKHCTGVWNIIIIKYRGSILWLPYNINARDY